MASQSSAENIATSSAEGNAENITQLDNPSVAGPSGVKVKHIPKIVVFKSCAADNSKESSEIREDYVNVGLGSESGSSDSDKEVLNQQDKNGSSDSSSDSDKEVLNQQDKNGSSDSSSDSDKEELNQPDENGSSDSSSEENLPDPADAIRDAHEAASIARDAAASCRKTLDDSYNLIEFCNKRFDSSVRKARAVVRGREAARYRSLAQKYQRASERVQTLIPEAQHSAELADITADGADYSATRLAEVVDIAPKSVKDRQLEAIEAVRAAKSNALSAHKGKYLLLKGMKQTWEDIISTEVSRTESSVSSSDDGKFMKIITTVFAAILSLVGFAFLLVAFLTKLSKRTREALMALGFLMLSISSLIIVYKIWRCFYKKLKARERKRRRGMVAGIEAELRSLDDYFEENGVTESDLLAEPEGEN